MTQFLQGKWSDVRCVLHGARIAWVSVLSAVAGFLLFLRSPEARDLFLEVGDLQSNLVFWARFFLLVVFVWTFPVFVSARWILTQFQEGTSQTANVEAVPIWVRNRIPTGLVVLCFTALLVGQFGALNNAPKISDASIRGTIDEAESALERAAQTQKRPQQVQSAIKDEKAQSSTCTSKLFSDEECRGLLRSVVIVLGSRIKRWGNEPLVVFGLISFIVLWVYFGTISNQSQRSVGRRVGLLVAAIALIVTSGSSFDINRVDRLPILWVAPYIFFATIVMMLGIVTLLFVWGRDPRFFRIFWWLGTLCAVPAVILVTFAVYAIIVLENEAVFGLAHLAYLPFGTIVAGIVLWAIVRHEGLAAKFFRLIARLGGAVEKIRLLNPMFYFTLAASVIAVIGFVAMDPLDVTGVVHRALLLPFLLGLPVAGLTYVTYWSTRSRFPFVLATVLLVGIIGPFEGFLRGDYYVVRTLDKKTDPRQTLDEAVHHWALANQCVLQNESPKLPEQASFKSCSEIAPIIVAAAGGANRAAFHTAGVIGALLDKDRLAPIAGSREFTSAAFSPDGTRIVTASFDKTARIWDANSGKELAKLEGHEGGVYSARFSPDGKQIVTAAWEKTAPVRLWDVSSLLDVKEIRRLGHTDDVNSAVFSTDGKVIVTASDDKTARVWDASSGVELLKLVGHEGLVHSAAISPDGKRVVTGAWEKTAPVRLWDMADGREIKQLVGHEVDVNSVSFSSDGQLIVTASDDTTARIWSADSGAELAKLKGHAGRVVSAAFSPDGKAIVTGSEDNTARIWDISNLKDPKEVRKLTEHFDDVRDARFSAGGNLIVTASKDRRVRVWNAKIGQLEPWKPISGPNSFGNQLFAISAVSGGALGAVVSYAALADSQREDRATNGLNNPPCAMAAFQTDRDYFKAGGANPASLWRDCLQLLVAGDFLSPVVLGMTSSDPLPFHWRGDRAELLELAWEKRYERFTNQKTLAEPLSQLRRTIPATGWVPMLLLNGTLVDDGRRIITSDVDLVQRDARGLVVSGVLRDAEDLHSLLGTRETLGDQDAVYGVTVSKDGKYLATASKDNAARIWEVETGNEVGTFKGHTARVASAGFSPDGKLFVTASDDRTARIWDSATRAEIKRLLHPKDVNSAAFSPDGRLIVTASDDQIGRVWDASTGAKLVELTGHEGLIYSAAFSPDSKQVVTAAWEKSAPVRLWDVANGKEVRRFIGHTGDVNSASFNADGRFIVTASDDRTARIWDASSGTELAKLKGHSSFVYGAAFSPDSKSLITVSRDRSVMMWDTSVIEQPKSVWRKLEHKGEVRSAAFSGTGEFFVTGSKDKSALLWNSKTGRPKRAMKKYDQLLPCDGLGCDIRLSTAVTMSARFPIISPPGSIVDRHKRTRTIGRVVDGGYHDNFGATTALELKKGLAKFGLRAVVVLINTEPTFNGLECVEQEGERQKGLHISKLSADSWLWFPTFLSPLNAIENSRVGRGSHATVDLCMELREEDSSPETRLKSADRFAFITVGQDPTPVSWWMSKRVQRNLDDQLNSGGVNRDAFQTVSKMRPRQ